MTDQAPTSRAAVIGDVKEPFTLGDFFSKRAFSREEEARIAAAAAVTGSACLNILKNYAARTEPFKVWATVERVAGARSGSPLYKKNSIPRIVSRLAAPSQRNYRLAFGIYREAARLYIEKELSALDTLLMETETTVTVTPADALRATCSYAVEFGVSREDLLRFYEIWGVERVPDFESLLAEWMKPDEVAQQRRQIAALSTEVIALRAQLAGATGEIATLRQAVDRVETSALRAGSLHGEMADMNRALGERVGEFADDLARADARLSNFGSEIQSAVEAIAHLRGLRADLERVEHQATKSASEVSEQSNAMARELRREIEAVTTVVETKVVELSATVAEAANARASRSRTSSAPRPLRVGGSFEWPSAQRVLSSKSEFLKALSASFRARGVDPAAARRIHAAIGARLPMVVVGAMGIDALEAYADVAFGGRLIKVHVTPALMEPADLFGRVDAERGAFRPHRSRLLDAMLTTDHALPGLVILEGINRAPTESYLVPLLSHRGSIRLFHETASAPDGVPAAIEWPRHLRLTATCIGGATSLPVARDVWARAVAIEVAPIDVASAAEPTAVTEIVTDGPLMGDAEVPADLLESIVKAWPEASACRAVMGRFGRQLAAAVSNEEELRRAVIETSVLPLITSLQNEQEHQAALEAIVCEVGVSHADDLRAMDARLRRSLG